MASTFGSDLGRGLRDIDLFAACTTGELRRVESLATPAHIDAGQIVFRRGEIGRECFVILGGEADIDIDGSHHTGTRGALIGEIALLVQGARRTATVVAVTDLTVLVFSRAEFGQLMNGLPAVAHKVLREAARRLVEDVDTNDKGATHPAHSGDGPDPRRSRAIDGGVIRTQLPIVGR
jgi:CRP/FNR family transcriptional regulator, cyclic AMP receptor protein